jgi:tRNA threonylcarbamoyladenosine biosynthesis protein TsaE
MEYTTESAEETKKLGGKIAYQLIADNQGLEVGSKAVVLALAGDLGSGKTTFAQGLAEGLGVKQRIISPTFIILRKYELGTKNKENRFKCFYHIDLYRLEGNLPEGGASVEQEITNLGLKEIWSDPTNIIAIEWAEKARGLIPKEAIWVEFGNVGKDRRKIKIDKGS